MKPTTASFLLCTLLILVLRNDDPKTRILKAAEAFVAPTGRSSVDRSPKKNHNLPVRQRESSSSRSQRLRYIFRSSANKQITHTDFPLGSFQFHLHATQQQYQDKEQQNELEKDDENSNRNNQNSEVEKLLMDAERLRLEAERMDANLTLQKIAALEEKLSNDAWLEKQQGQTVKDLYEKLRQLESKVSRPDSAVRPEFSVNEKIEKIMEESSSSTIDDTSSSSLKEGNEYSSSSSSAYDGNSNISKNRNLPPMAGFDDSDLNLYVPVAEDVNKMAPNATLDERITLFRDAPELQEHFKQKLQRLILEPLEELQELETLKEQYFGSSSSKEKDALLKQIKRLEAKVEENNIGMSTATDNGGSDANGSGGIGYSDKILIPQDRLPPLTENELEERFEAIKGLPDILVTIYLQRNGLYDLPAAISTIDVKLGSDGVNVVLNTKNDSATNANENDEDSEKNEDDVKRIEDDANGEGQDENENENSSTDVTPDASFDLYENLRLAIQMDYYDLQLQLLDQGRVIPLSDDMRKDFAAAYQSLPMQVRERYVVEKLEIKSLEASIITSDKDDDVERVLKEVLQPVDEPFAALSQATSAFGRGAKEQTATPPEYNDVEFVDRSRYLEEFLPAIASLEEMHPSREDVDLFVTECLSGSGKKIFMVTSKPERVVGGYYIRGSNQMEPDTKSATTANERLAEGVYERLQNHPTLKDKIEFYYVLDPSPPSDEDLELEVNLNPIFIVTTKDPKTMYDLSSPMTKIAVTIAGLLSTFLFSIGSCVLNPKINASIETALDSVSSSASTTVYVDVDWFFSLCLPLYFSFLSILFAHELGHRIVASIYKFDIGLPTVVPSLSTGLAGSITPFKSPPPSKKALFDFAIAGPLAGLTVSICLLFVGLELTRQMGLDTNLPVLPVDLARASSLGGGMMQFFLGKYTLLPDQGPGAFVELHPFAVSGFIGCLTNALALLPLGHTDGGRISLAMFGRRGAFVVKLFTTLILTASGLFGLDEMNILLAYVVFTLIWQRELESPIRNEVDELSFSRGLVGIISAVAVGLILIPMTS